MLLSWLIVFVPEFIIVFFFIATFLFLEHTDHCHIFQAFATFAFCSKVVGIYRIVDPILTVY